MRRIHPLIRDFGITALTQASVFGASLLVIGILGRFAGAEPLAEYLMLRRVLAWFMSGALLGLGVALPRYVAMSVTTTKTDAYSYFVAAFAILTSLSLAVVLVLNNWGVQFAILLFGSAGFKALVLPLSLAVLTWTVQASIYGYYRGKLEMVAANSLQFLNMALSPALVVVICRTSPVATIVTTIALVNLCICFLFGAPIALQVKWRGVSGIGGRAKELLCYGLPRVLGDFAGAAPSAVAPIIALRFMPLTAVSPLLLGMSIMTAVSMSVSPVGLVLLSKISMMLSLGQQQEIRKHIERLEAAIIQLSTFLCLQFSVFADVIVRTWVGKSLWHDLFVIRIILCAMPFYLYWVALRSTVDAATVYAYDARNNLIAFLVFIVTTGVLLAFHLQRDHILTSIAVTLAGGTVTLAVMTAHTIRKLYGTRSRITESILPLALAGCLGGISLAVHIVDGMLQSLLPAAAFGAALGTIFLLCLWSNRSGWMPHLVKTAFSVGQAA